MGTQDKLTPAQKAEQAMQKDKEEKERLEKEATEKAENEAKAEEKRLAEEKVAKEAKEKEAKEKKEAEGKSAEEKAEAEKKAEEEKAEEERVQKKSEELGIPTDEVLALETEEKKSAPEQMIKDIALQDNITEDEAKEVFEKEKAIAEKYDIEYDSDSRGIVKAYRSTQSAYDKEKAAKEKPKLSDDEAKEKVLARFRPMFPDKDDSEIEAIVRTSHIIASQMIQGVQQPTQELQSKAKVAEFKANLKDSEKTLIPEIDKLLAKTPRSLIIDPKFDFKDIITYAKGLKSGELESSIEERIKKAREEGKKEGIESRQILGANEIKTKTGKVEEGVGKLTKEQEEERIRMNVNEKTYLVLLEKTKERAKKKNKPEPSLVSTPLI